MPLAPLRLLVGALLLLAACDTAAPDGDDPGPAASLTDTWTGQVTAQGRTHTLTLEITNRQTEVTGTGTLRTDGAEVRFTVRGSYLHPSIAWQLTFTDRPPADLRGLVTDDRARIQATLSGAGFGGEGILLSRQ